MVVVGVVVTVISNGAGHEKSALLSQEKIPASLMAFYM